MKPSEDAGGGRSEPMARKSPVVTAGIAGVTKKSVVAKQEIDERRLVGGHALVGQRMGDAGPIFAEND